MTKHVLSLIATVMLVSTLGVLLIGQMPNGTTRGDWEIVFTVLFVGIMLYWKLDER